MKRLGLLLVACGSSASPRTGARAQAFIRDEAALQQTVQDGPASAFVKAAGALLEDGLALARECKGDKVLAGELAYVDDLIAVVDSNAGFGSFEGRRMIAQPTHEVTSALALAPLPYAVDPAAAERDAEVVAAIATPHGGADEAMGVFHDDRDRMCACQDAACAVAVFRSISTHGLTYRDVQLSEAQSAERMRVRQQVNLCYQQVVR